MDLPLLIIHERLGRWARLLRPRFGGGAARWAETRSRADLAGACGRSVAPVAVVDLGDRAGRMLGDLEAALAVAPGMLTVVLDPGDDREVAVVARELGATLVLGGVVVPPVVERIVGRWLPLAQGRAARDGWAPGDPADLPFWERPDFFPSGFLPPA